MLSACERGGDGFFSSLSFEGFDVVDILFGEDELCTTFLALAGRRGGDE